MRNVPTVVGEGVPVAEVDEGGERLDAVALGQLWVLQLHHLDAVHVTLVINVLQLCDHLVTGPTVLFV